MIDPRLVRVSVPCYDGKVVNELCGSLIASARFFSGITFQSGVSHVALARNFAVHSFLNSTHDWLVTIDSDIGFRPPDFLFLVEPCDEAREVATVTPTRVKTKLLQPRGTPTKNGTLQVDEVIGEADALVSAEYSYKDDRLAPCRLGLGFTRIHRSVFEAIAALKHENGEPRCWQFQAQGQLLTDYFPCGALFSQLVPNAQFVGEDHGFFMLAKMAGFIPRIETRTQLFHIGTKAYPYAGDQGGGN